MVVRCRVIVRERFGFSRCVLVFVFMFVCHADTALPALLPHSAHACEGAAKNKHPSALQAEISTLANELHDHPSTEPDECDTDDAPHPDVEPFRDRRSEKNGGAAEKQDDGCVSDRIQERQPQTPAAIFGSAAEIGDRRDVIPVHAVAQSKTKCC